MGQPSTTDTLTLGLSEDAYKGVAQTVTASDAAGKQQQFTFTGNWGAGPHKVAVKHLNDAYGGTSATNRDLYLVSANYNGQDYANIGEGMYSVGETAQLTVQAPSQVASAATASPTPQASSSTSPPHMSLVGVTLAGPAFAPQKLPGVLGTDYVYPTQGCSTLWSGEHSE